MSRRKESADDVEARRAARAHADHVGSVVRSVRVEAYRRGTSLRDELERRRGHLSERVYGDVRAALVALGLERE